MWIESLNFQLDVNHDGWISMMEALGGLKFVYMLPGNLLLEIVGQFPSLAGLFQIHASAQNGYSSLNGWFSLLFSLIVWLYVLVKLSDLRDYLRRRLTAHSKSHDNSRRPHHPA